MKEKLQEYALIAEIIGAIAIVISLLFVGLQISQSNEETALNTKAIQSSVRQSILHEDLEGLYLYMDYPYLNKRVDISPEEEVQVKAQIISFIRMRESLWLQYHDGLIDEETWLSYRQPLTNVVFQSQIGRDMWEWGGYSPLFRQEIDEWIGSLDLEDLDTVLPD